MTKKTTTSIDAESRARATLRIGADELRTTGYVRTSTDDETQDKNRQLKGLKAVLEAHPQLKPIPLYMETASGKGGNHRVQFNKMMADAAMNRFDALLVWEVDRFGRDFYEGQANCKKLFDMGITLYFCDLNIWFDANDELHQILIAVHFMMAQGERKKISKRSREGTEGMKEDLEVFRQENNILSVRKGGRGGLFEMVCKDTSIPAHKKAKQNKAKKGLMYVEVPHARDIYRVAWSEGVPIRELRDTFRKPVNPECVNNCWNGKELPFDGLPTHDNADCSTAVIDWTEYVKPDDKLPQTAFKTSGASKGKKTCNCARRISKKQISIINNRMDLPLRHERAFRSDEIVSEAVDWEDVISEGGKIKTA